MSGDPERWSSSESDASEFERSLIASLASQGPDERTRRAMYDGVMAGLGASAAGAVLATTTPAKASLLAGVAKLGWLKLTLLALVIGASSAALLAVGRPKPVQKGARPPAPAVREHVEDVEVAVPEEEPVEPPAIKPKTPSRDVRLMRESKLLVEARAALKQNELARTALLLSRADAQFPRGELRQEREVLHIQLLRARGDHAQAERRARAFVKAHPESPHAQKVLRSRDAP